MGKKSKALRDAVDASRQFPTNTCPASRHVQQMGEHLTEGLPFPALLAEPQHCGESMLLTVKALYEARAELDQLRARVQELGSVARENCSRAVVKMEVELDKLLDRVDEEVFFKPVAPAAQGGGHD